MRAMSRSAAWSAMASVASRFFCACLEGGELLGELGLGHVQRLRPVGEARCLGVELRLALADRREQRVACRPAAARRAPPPRRAISPSLLGERAAALGQAQRGRGDEAEHDQADAADRRDARARAWLSAPRRRRARSAPRSGRPRCLRARRPSAACAAGSRAAAAPRLRHLGQVGGRGAGERGRRLRRERHRPDRRGGVIGRIARGRGRRGSTRATGDGLGRRRATATGARRRGLRAAAARRGARGGSGSRTAASSSRSWAAAVSARPISWPSSLLAVLGRRRAPRRAWCGPARSAASA